MLTLFGWKYNKNGIFAAGGKSLFVTVHSVLSNTLRDAQNLC